jgi:hypothetical protein
LKEHIAREREAEDIQTAYNAEKKTRRQQFIKCSLKCLENIRGFYPALLSGTFHTGIAGRTIFLLKEEKIILYYSIKSCHPKMHIGKL